MSFFLTVDKFLLCGGWEDILPSLSGKSFFCVIGCVVILGEIIPRYQSKLPLEQFSDLLESYPSIIFTERICKFVCKMFIK